MITGDMKLGSFGLDHGGQCKLTHDRPSVPPLGDGAQISLSHVSFTNPDSQCQN